MNNFEIVNTTMQQLNNLTGLNIPVVIVPEQPMSFIGRLIKSAKCKESINLNKLAFTVSKRNDGTHKFIGVGDELINECFTDANACRFVLGHEFGHLLLGHHDIFNLRKPLVLQSFINGFNISSKYIRKELECDLVSYHLNTKLGLTKDQIFSGVSKTMDYYKSFADDLGIGLLQQRFDLLHQLVS